MPLSREQPNTIISDIKHKRVCDAMSVAKQNPLLLSSLIGDYIIGSIIMK